VPTPAIDPFAQLFARLEERRHLRGDGYSLAGAWIAPIGGIAPPHREGAKTAQLDAIAARQRIGDLVKYHRHDQLNSRLPKMRMAGGEFRDEF
jgi:glutathione S-transferase